MEHTKPNKSDAFEYVRRKVEPIFSKVAKEAVKNRMPVGRPKLSAKEYCFYSPHNYRLYFDFSKANFNPDITNQTKGKKLRGGRFNHRIKNSTEHEFDNYLDCRITVKKTQIEVQNKIEVKKWYKIPINENSSQDIFKIVQKKDKQCIKVLRTFIETFGGSSKFNILNRVSEDKFIGENVINKIGQQENWHMKTHKKVYKEKCIEFYGPAHAANYIENRAIDSQSPYIMNGILELRELGYKLESITRLHDRKLNLLNKKITPLSLLQKVKNRLNCINDLFKPTPKRLIKKLNNYDIVDLELWLFKKFGGA